MKRSFLLFILLIITVAFISFGTICFGVDEQPESDVEYPTDLYTYDMVSGEKIGVVCTGYGIYVRFTPVIGGEYWFESESSFDTSCILLDEEFKLVYMGEEFWNSGDAANFRFKFTLFAGKTYYYLIQVPEESRIHSLPFNVILNMHQPEAGHVHEWVETVTKAPTCEEEGELTTSCVCTMKTVVPIPKIEHSGIETVIQPTCTQDGEKTTVCSICGETVVEVIPSLGHEFKAEFVVDREPTCTAAGSESFHCIRCGLSQSGTSKTIPANGHSYGEWTVLKPSTCVQTGTQQRICSVCSDQDTISSPVLGHSFSKKYTVDKQATCTSDGSKSFHCERCDASTGSVIIPAAGHSFGSWKTSKAATCTAAGSRQRTCSRCSAKETETISALGHSFSTQYTVDKKATCTSDGSKSFHCERCGVKKGSKTIKATGHSFGAYKTVKKATCTQNGKKVRTCKLCKKEQSAVIDKKGHNYSKSYTVDKKATFSSDGSRSLHCSRCDSLKNKTTIPRVSKIKLSKTSFSYDGKTKKPSVSVKDSKGTALSKKYYTVTYEKSSVSVGAHYLTIKLSGLYSGTKKLKYTILPGTVSSLSYTPGVNCVNLSWSAVKGAQGYKVYIYNDGSKQYELFAKTTKTSFTPALKAGSAGKFAVKAFKTVGGKDYLSPEFTKISAASKPSSVNLSAKRSLSREVKLSWNKVACSGYEIYMSTARGSGYEKIKTISSADLTSFFKSGLKSGQPYFFKVRAYTSVGGSRLYSEFSSPVACVPS